MSSHGYHDPSKSKNCSWRKPVRNRDSSPRAAGSRTKSGKKSCYHKSGSGNSHPYERKTINSHSPWSNGNNKKKKKKVQDLSKSRNCSCKSRSKGDWHRHHDSSPKGSGVKKKAHRGGTRCDMRRAHFSAGRMNAIKKCIRQTENLDMDIEELGGGAWKCSFTGRNGRRIERVVDCPSHGHTCSERGDLDGAKTLYFSICEMLDNCYYPS